MIEQERVPGTIQIDCPRKGCGTPTAANRAGKLQTHKLPDGHRVCAASGETTEDAIIMDAPAPIKDKEQG